MGCTYHFWRKKKKKKLKCGNGIAEIGKKKFLAIVAMPLPKMGGKKNSGCQNHMWGIKKKICYVYNIFTTFSQQITGN